MPMRGLQRTLRDFWGADPKPVKAYDGPTQAFGRLGVSSGKSSSSSNSGNDTVSKRWRGEGNERDIAEREL